MSLSFFELTKIINFWRYLEDTDTIVEISDSLSLVLETCLMLLQAYSSFDFSLGLFDRPQIGRTIWVANKPNMG